MTRPGEAEAVEAAMRALCADTAAGRRRANLLLPDVRVAVDLQ